MQVSIYNKELFAVLLNEYPSEESSLLVVTLSILSEVCSCDVFFIRIFCCFGLVVHRTFAMHGNTLLDPDSVIFVAVSAFVIEYVIIRKCGNVFVLCLQVAVVLLKSDNVRHKLGNRFQREHRISAFPALVFSRHLIPNVTLVVCPNVIGHYGERNSAFSSSEEAAENISFIVGVGAVSSYSYVQSNAVLINAVLSRFYVVISSLCNGCDASGVVCMAVCGVLNLAVNHYVKSCGEVSL